MNIFKELFFLFMWIKPYKPITENQLIELLSDGEILHREYEPITLSIILMNIILNLFWIMPLCIFIVFYYDLMVYGIVSI